MTATPPDRPKGHRPYYFDDPAVDQLHAALLAMATELAVAFDRIDTLERLLESRLGVARAEIEGYIADETVAAQRAARHADIAARLLKPFRDYREELFARAAHEHGPAGGLNPDATVRRPDAGGGSAGTGSAAR